MTQTHYTPKDFLSADFRPEGPISPYDVNHEVSAPDLKAAVRVILQSLDDKPDGVSIVVSGEKVSRMHTNAAHGFNVCWCAVLMLFKKGVIARRDDGRLYRVAKESSNAS
jgi:hypothetical protein